MIEKLQELINDKLTLRAAVAKINELIDAHNETCDDNADSRLTAVESGRQATNAGINRLDRVKEDKEQYKK